MNTWKEYLIEYIQNLDEKMPLERANELIAIELMKMKEEFLKKSNEDKSEMVTANNTQLNKNTSIQELIALFRELFYGRQDVYAVRWENEKVGKDGYSPKCKNEWERNICGKQKGIKGACKTCSYRENQEITDEAVRQHFTGMGKNSLVMGVYPLLECVEIISRYYSFRYKC